jgi:hypothetical protein
MVMNIPLVARYRNLVILSFGKILEAVEPLGTIKKDGGFK